MALLAPQQTPTITQGKGKLWSPCPPPHCCLKFYYGLVRPEPFPQAPLRNTGSWAPPQEI